MNTITNFFKQTYMEMKHVVWPSRKRAVIYALVVILFSVALGYLLGGFDILFKYLVGGLLY
jgi:preprotein translocase SecE subunit